MGLFIFRFPLFFSADSGRNTVENMLEHIFKETPYAGCVRFNASADQPPSVIAGLTERRASSARSGRPDTSGDALFDKLSSSASAGSNK